MHVSIYNEDGEKIGSANFVGGEPDRHDVLLINDDQPVEIVSRRWRRCQDDMCLDSIIVTYL